MSKKNENNKDDEKLTFSNYELFCTDFLSKFSLLITTTIAFSLYILISLLSDCTKQDIVFSSFYLFIFILFVLAIISIFLLVAPIIFQCFIFLVEDETDEKLKFKRSINRFNLGLCLLTFIILLLTGRAILSLAKQKSMILFFIGFFIDIVMVIFNNFYYQREKESKSISHYDKFLIICSALSLVFLLSINFSVRNAILTSSIKSLILYSLYLTNAFKKYNISEKKDSYKKNLNLLSLFLTLALYSILIYFLFQNDILNWINNHEYCVVNFIYAHLYKIVADSPLKLGGIFQMR